MRIYWVNAADVTDVTGPYSAGQSVDTPTFTGVLQGPDAALGFYAANEVDCPEFYSREFAPHNPPARGFVGTVGSDAARVQEECVQFPIETVYQAKLGGIRMADDTVRYNAVDTALSVNWWLIVSASLRFELEGIQGSWLQRQQDGLAFPGGPNAPWVGIFNAANGRARREQVTEAQWETLYQEKTIHDQDCGNATNANRAALDAAYNDGAGNWQDVADHDPSHTNPAWGYPPTVSLSGEAVVFL